jgi:phospholipase C
MKYRVTMFGGLTAAFTVGMVSALADGDHARQFRTATPIKHLVVIFQENVSFDHYFGTYPNALNLYGEETVSRFAEDADQHQ